MNQSDEGLVVVTDHERQTNYWKWKAFQESDWEFFGVPKGASVRLSRIEEDDATALRWEITAEQPQSLAA